jgi:hypothetical protein
MKLLELYSLSSGLKIKDQFLVEKFYPISADKFICVHAGSGQPAKIYPYWPEVLSLIHKILKEHGISIVQIGRDDPPLPYCINELNKTDIHQTNYILSRSLALVCNDSWTAHRAGFLKIPIIELFGSTDPKNHAPYEFNENKTIFLVSHRFNKNPSFQAQEQPSTIALLPPEEIANSILKLLNIDCTFSHNSLFFGPLYQQSIIELVPNCIFPAQFQVPNPLVVRMDYEFNENFLVENLKIRKCIIITDKEINPNILATFKQNIVLLRAEIDSIDSKWFKIIKRIGLNVNYYSIEKDEIKLSVKRLQLFNSCYFDQINFPAKNDAKSSIEAYTNKKLDENFDMEKIKFKTNKFIFNTDKLYLSKAHWKKNIFVQSFDDNVGNVIDSEDFWIDQHYFYFHT